MPLSYAVERTPYERCDRILDLPSIGPHWWERGEVVGWVWHPSWWSRSFIARPVPDADGSQPADRIFEVWGAAVVWLVARATGELEDCRFPGFPTVVMA